MDRDRMNEKPERYDDYAFNFFVGGVLVLIMVPWTFFWLRSFFKRKVDIGTDCECPPCHKKYRRLHLKASGSSWIGMLKLVLWLLLWGLLLFVVWRSIFRVPEDAVEPWNPYTILGLEEGASEGDVRKAHRTLSLKWHPDHNPDDPEAMANFIEVGRAYETLTSEIVRANYEKYGNPDGPQAPSVGIALPTWLLDRSNSPVVLFVYIGGILLLLPIGVVLVLRRWGRLATNKVNIQTMGLYSSKLREQDNVHVRTMLELLGVSLECKECVSVRARDEALLSQVVAALPSSHRLPKKPEFNVPFAVKCNILLHAHLARLQDMLTTELHYDLVRVLELAPDLIGGMALILEDRRKAHPLLKCLKLMQMIVQGQWDAMAIDGGYRGRESRKMELLQLPHITPEMVDECSRKRWTVETIPQFTKHFFGSRRRELLAALELAPSQAADIARVCSLVPYRIGVHIAVRVVEGEHEEQIISPSCIGTLRIRLQRMANPIPDGFCSSCSIKASSPSASADTLRRLSPTNDGLTSQSSSPQQVGGDVSSSNEEKDEIKSQSTEPPTVHCPYFPLPRNEGWWLLLVDSSQSLLVGCSRASLGAGIGASVESKILFPTPEKLANYNWLLHVVCDSYIGFDQRVEVRFTVEPPPERHIEGSEEDDSEIEEEENTETGSSSDEDEGQDVESDGLESEDD